MSSSHPEIYSEPWSKTRQRDVTEKKARVNIVLAAWLSDKRRKEVKCHVKILKYH